MLPACGRREGCQVRRRRLRVLPAVRLLVAAPVFLLAEQVHREHAARCAADVCQLVPCRGEFSRLRNERLPARTARPSTTSSRSRSRQLSNVPSSVASLIFTRKRCNSRPRSSALRRPGTMWGRCRSAAVIGVGALAVTAARDQRLQHPADKAGGPGLTFQHAQHDRQHRPARLLELRRLARQPDGVQGRPTAGVGLPQPVVVRPGGAERWVVVERAPVVRLGSF